MRKLVTTLGLSYHDPCPFAGASAGATLGEALLTPTRIYVQAVLPLIQ